MDTKKKNCPRCGQVFELKEVQEACLHDRVTGKASYVMPGHEAACGLPCHPAGITYHASDFPDGIHFGVGNCPRCQPEVTV